MNRHPAIQAAIANSQPAASDVNFHSNVHDRAEALKCERRAAAKRTLDMANAMMDAIKEAYGADSAEYSDAVIAQARTASAWAKMQTEWARSFQRAA